MLTALAHDSMEGRGTGTRGGARAARFIAEEFRRAGLEPVGDSGYFQRVPITLLRRGEGRTTARRVASFALRDTFPADQRGLAVNVLGVLRGSDPVLKDSIVLVDAHYDHVGLALRPADADSLRAWRALTESIIAERDRFQTRLLAGRGPMNNPPLTQDEQQKDAEFRRRLRAVHVNMDSLRRVHSRARLDSVFNGADDDASGVVAVIEIARQLAAGPRPKRTILFAATTGEEVGLIGTRWYIEHPAFPNAAIQSNLEIEMIGRPDSLAGGFGRGWLTGFERSTMGEMFKAAGIAISPDMRPNENFFMRSDNIAFARMGIPAHTLSSFNLHTDYHQLTDEVDKVDFPHMAAVINAAVSAVRLLANGEAPRWNPGGKP